MKAVILSGGHGTRGRPFTDFVPKAMIPVQGKPLIYHLVRYLSSFNVIDEIIILADFTGIGKQIESYFEGNILVKKPIRFVQDSQSGTGGDLLHLSRFLGKGSDFLLWFVDNLSPIDIKVMHKFHKQKKTIATIATRKYRKEETGFAVIRDGLVKEFKEKPAIELGMAECLGVYMLNSKILSSIRSKKPRKKDLNLSYDILQPMSKSGEISAYDIGRIPWIDIDSPTRVDRNKELVSQIIKKLGT